VEMGLRLSGVPHQTRGVTQAMAYLTETADSAKISAQKVPA
jgi:hypothetical protein